MGDKEGIRKNVNMPVYWNVNSDIIATTEDKLNLAFQQHEAIVKKKHSWKKTLALCLSLLVTNLTATFRDVFWFSGETWRAIFIILFVASFLWLVYDLLEINRYKDNDIKRIIEYLKGKEASY